MKNSAILAGPVVIFTQFPGMMPWPMIMITTIMQGDRGHAAEIVAIIAERGDPSLVLAFYWLVRRRKAQ